MSDAEDGGDDSKSDEQIIDDENKKGMFINGLLKT